MITKPASADATQMMVRIQEDAVDLRKRMEGKEVDEGELLAARLLDLRKAYPRVNKPALWGILQKYGQRGKFLGTRRPSTRSGGKTG